jgi:hypothetical protein
MQRRTRGIRGAMVVLMAVLTTLATLAPALADVRGGPWPQ